MAQKKILDYGDISEEDFALPLLSDLLDQEIVIEGFRVEDSPKGQYAVVYLMDEDGGFRTTSDILINRLVRIEGHFEDGNAVKAKLVEVDTENGYSYLTLE